jgi:lysozyme
MMTDPALPLAVSTIAAFEGFTPFPIPDVRKWQIGYGFNYLPNGAAVTSVTLAMTEPQAREMLTTIVARTLALVRDMVHVPLTNNQAAALTSFAFNNGTGALRGSTALRLLNEGEPSTTAIQYIASYVHADGKVCPALVKRRAAETALFLTPDDTAPVVDDADTLNAAELAKFA